MISRFYAKCMDCRVMAGECQWIMKRYKGILFKRMDLVGSLPSRKHLLDFPSLKSHGHKNPTHCFFCFFSFHVISIVIVNYYIVNIKLYITYVLLCGFDCLFSKECEILNTIPQASALFSTRRRNELFLTNWFTSAI